MNAAKKLDPAPQMATPLHEAPTENPREFSALQVRWDEVHSWAQALARTYQSRPRPVERGAIHRV